MDLGGDFGLDFTGFGMGYRDFGMEYRGGIWAGFYGIKRWDFGVGFGIGLPVFWLDPGLDFGENSRVPGLIRARCRPAVGGQRRGYDSRVYGGQQQPQYWGQPGNRGVSAGGFGGVRGGSGGVWAFLGRFWAGSGVVLGHFWAGSEVVLGLFPLPAASPAPPGCFSTNSWHFRVLSGSFPGHFPLVRTGFYWF